MRAQILSIGRQPEGRKDQRTHVNLARGDQFHQAIKGNDVAADVLGLAFDAANPTCIIRKITQGNERIKEFGIRAGGLDNVEAAGSGGPVLTLLPPSLRGVRSLGVLRPRQSALRWAPTATDARPREPAGQCGTVQSPEHGRAPGHRAARSQHPRLQRRHGRRPRSSRPEYLRKDSSCSSKVKNLV